MAAQEIFPFQEWPENILQARYPANDNSIRSEVLFRGALSILSAQPGGPTEGDIHIIGAAPSGLQWSAFAENDVAIYKGGTWLAFLPFEGWLKKDLDSGDVLEFDGLAWVAFGGGSGGGAERNTVTAVTSSSGVLNLDYSLGDYFTVTLSENVTSLTFSNLPGSGKGATLALRITQDSTPRTFAWPAAFKFAGGTPPAISSGSGAVDLLIMSTFNNGTTWQVDLAKGYA